MDQVGAALAALQSALPAIGGALSPLSVPVVGLIAVVLAAWVGTREAANINAAAQKEIAKTNAESSRQIEQIKADGQRKLEREKFNRDWRRQRVAPLLDKLEELRKADMGVLAAALATPALRPSLLDQATKEITQRRFTIFADLNGLCPPELEERLQVLLDAEDCWVPGFMEWAEEPIDAADPARATLWEQQLQEAQKALTRFARTIDDYIYTVDN